ncbi:MAG TPA: Lrp/AsnC family transcriptional regulator [Alphaproteobacteria bacterium]|nr:Lrp/AsnC family transcriptional regulator [Alphaproteobacteria bacterium]
MKHVKLDRIDLRILRELQKDGRMTNVELAQRVGISAPPCLRRVRALEESGYIRGYHADVAADKLGFGITVFTLVSLTNHAETDLQNFAKMVETWPEVRESYMMTGDADFIIKIVAEDWEAFQKFLTHKLAGAPNVAHYKSAPAMQRTKYDPGVPIDDSKGAAPAKE